MVDRLNKKTKESYEIAPLRSLDDFLLKSARFQVPSMNWEKWGNRVTSNLLYYQTNYFLLAILIFLIFAMIHPVQIVAGFLLVALLIYIFGLIMNEAGSLAEFKRRYRLISTVGIILISYYLSSLLLGSLIILVLALLLPFCAIFVHASLRLRNISNKLKYTLETCYTDTPMGFFLQELDVKLQAFGNFLDKRTRELDQKTRELKEKNKRL